MLPVLKHFPGQGHADADTHERPATVPSLDLLRTSDLLPYEALLDDAPLGVMVGHLDVPGLTEAGRARLPVPGGHRAAARRLRVRRASSSRTTSPPCRRCWRASACPEAAERALAAGADLLLLAQPTDVEAVLDRLEEAVNLGRIPDRRLDAALARVVEVGCPAERCRSAGVEDVDDEHERGAGA